MTRSVRSDSDEDATPQTLMRRGFLQAVLVAIGAMAAVGLAWVIGRGAPSAGRDAEFTPPAPAPTSEAATAVPNEGDE